MACCSALSSMTSFFCCSCFAVVRRRPFHPAIHLAAPHLGRKDEQPASDRMTDAFSGLEIEFIGVPWAADDEPLQAELVLVRTRGQHGADDLAGAHRGAVMRTMICK